MSSRGLRPARRARPAGQPARQEPSRAASARSSASRAASARISSSRSVARAAQRLALLVGGVLVVHGRVRRYEEDVARSSAVGRPGVGREQRGGRADGDGGPGQQRGLVEHLAGPGVGVGVGDDTPSTSSGRAASTRGVVGGVDGLGEVAPAGQGGDAVLAEVLDGGQHVGARRQQPAVAERAEDPGVVGGGRAQVEQLPFGGGDGVVEQLAQLVGVAVELLGGRAVVGGAPGSRRAGRARRLRHRRGRPCRRLVPSARASGRAGGAPPRPRSGSRSVRQPLARAPRPRRARRSAS